MFYNDKIAIEVSPGSVNRFLVRPCKDDNSICRGVDGCSTRVGEFDSVMGLTRPVGSRAIHIARIDQIIRGRLNWSQENEMTVRDAIVHCEWIAESFRCKSNRGCGGWGGSWSL